ncbi:MAG: hypothetical protein CM15mP83_6070 [Flavobacteriaceae bacterium]|nr:MAG: hypothetical protein CM15mP83_6070 [Flavobacteriaceae bacterium]
MDCITNEGDELIIPEPFYANYDTFAAACGVKVVPVHRQLIEFFITSIDVLKEKSMKNTSDFICNPNNPTGYVYSKGAQ